jgi:hypothetical protein
LPAASPPNNWASRPSSTAPASPSAPRPSSAPPSTAPTPGTSSPYLPPGGSFDYHGTSTQGAPPVVSSQSSYTPPPSVSYTNVSAARTISIGNSRMPRPVDDSTGLRNTVNQQPIDIQDLPKTP